MSGLWKRRKNRPSRHRDPSAAVSGYMETIRRAEVAGLPAPPAALNGLGDAYLDLGEEMLAGEHYVQAAEGFAAEGLYDSAIACCRKVLRRDERHSRAGVLLGRYYAAKGLEAEALEVLTGIATRRDEAGERAGAVTAMEEVVRIAPGVPRLRERLGSLLQREGRHEDALGEYRAALELCLQAVDPAGAEHARTRIEALEASLSEPGTGPAPDSAAKTPTGIPRPDEPDPRTEG